MRKAAVRLLWRTLAVLSLLLGVVGAVLPVLPTVPFLILAAWAGGKGWPALEHWLLNHAHFGPGIRRWRERGAVHEEVEPTELLIDLPDCRGDVAVRRDIAREHER